MKKFIPLLLIGALLSSISCRQADELETTVNTLNSKSISLKENGTINTTTSVNDSINLNQNINSNVANDPKDLDFQHW